MNKLLFAAFCLVQLQVSANKKTEEQEKMSDLKAIPVGQENLLLNKQMMLQMGVPPGMVFSSQVTDIFSH
jgi:hypothetical protein